MGKAKEEADSPIKEKVGIAESLLNLFWRAHNRCRIRNAPVRCHRLPRPYRTDFFRSVVTDSENEIELRRVRFREFVPTLASKAAYRDVREFKLVQCLRAHFSRRIASSTISSELRASLEVHDPLSHDRPRRVARTEEQ